MSTTRGQSSASRHEQRPDGRTSSDLDRKAAKLAMDMPNIVVPSGQAPGSPGRSFSLKLRGGDTGGSIMMFEETIPAGRTRTFHLPHHCDEVHYALSGEPTIDIGDE